VLNSYSGGTTTNFGSDTKLFSYNKYYHVKLHVVIGDADSFTATLYVDGESLGTSNVFLNPEKKEGYQPSTQVNAVNLYYQKAAIFVMYIDNVSLTVKQ
jgi:outer membrane autotransporter protein